MASRTLPRTRSTRLQLGVEFYKAPTASEYGLGIVALTNRSITHGHARPTAREVISCCSRHWVWAKYCFLKKWLWVWPIIGRRNKWERITGHETIRDRRYCIWCGSEALPLCARRLQEHWASIRKVLIAEDIWRLSQELRSAFTVF